MSEKRFEVVLNEYDEVEYIMDKEGMEDRDFADFMNFVEELAKENKQLKRKLYECEKDYLIETADISDKPFIEDEINELKKKYGVDNE